MGPFLRINVGAYEVSVFESTDPGAAPGAFDVVYERPFASPQRISSAPDLLLSLILNVYAAQRRERAGQGARA